MEIDKNWQVHYDLKVRWPFIIDTRLRRTQNEISLLALYSIESVWYSYRAKPYRSVLSLRFKTATDAAMACLILGDICSTHARVDLD